VVNSGVGTSVLQRHPIQVGIADATSYEVVSGLTQQDVIALPGDAEFRDGMAVKVMRMETTNASGASGAGS
jgi:hypothetical protein